jgi:hypothetical protein
MSWLAGIDDEEELGRTVLLACLGVASSSNGPSAHCLVTLGVMSRCGLLEYVYQQC